MNKTIIVCGHGPGISQAVAEKFGKEGFAVALAARSADKLAAAVEGLKKKDIRALAIPTDLSDEKAVRALVARAQKELGPVTIVHWNAYGSGAGDLTSAPVDELRKSLDIGVNNLVAAVQAALPDLRTQRDQSAVLVTGGGLSTYDAKVDAMAVQWGAMGLALTKAAQHKLVGVLGERLAKDGIYVGEVVVMAAVKGTAFDQGQATLEASTIADKFWALYKARTERGATIS